MDESYEKEIVYSQKFHTPRLVREIFDHMRSKQEEYRRKLKEDIFSATARMKDEQVWIEAYRISIEELLLT